MPLIIDISLQERDMLIQILNATSIQIKDAERVLKIRQALTNAKPEIKKVD